MKIEKLKEYECDQNDDDDDDDSVMMVFVAVSRAGKSRRFAIGLNMLCCRAQCFLTRWLSHRTIIIFLPVFTNSLYA